MAHLSRSPGCPPLFTVHCSVADPGERPGGPGGLVPPHLFSNQTEAQRAEKIFGHRSPLYLRASMTPPPLPTLSEGLDQPLRFHCNKQSSIAITSRTP